MGEHLIDGDFQSDKYPSCPRGKVPLSTKDPTAQDLLWMYAQRRRSVDASFSEDLEQALRNHGYDPGALDTRPLPRLLRELDELRSALRIRDGELQEAHQRIALVEGASFAPLRAAVLKLNANPDTRQADRDRVVDLACDLIRHERDRAVIDPPTDDCDDDDDRS